MDPFADDEKECAIHVPQLPQAAADGSWSDVFDQKGADLCAIAVP